MKIAAPERKTSVSVACREDRLSIRELSSLRKPTEQHERARSRARSGKWCQRPQPGAGNAASFAGSPHETLANLSITGHLRSFSDQPVAEIVQCGEPACKLNRINGLLVS